MLNSNKENSAPTHYEPGLFIQCPILPSSPRRHYGLATGDSREAFGAEVHGQAYRAREGGRRPYPPFVVLMHSFTSFRIMSPESGSIIMSKVERMVNW